MSKCGYKPVAIKSLPLEETMERWNSFNKIGCSNADCSGTAMVINANSHIELVQVLRSIR